MNLGELKFAKQNKTKKNKVIYLLKLILTSGYCGGSLFSKDPYDKDDAEADAIYESIDNSSTTTRYS